jgi:hypothetical protein
VVCGGMACVRDSGVVGGGGLIGVVCVCSLLMRHKREWPKFAPTLDAKRFLAQYPGGSDPGCLIMPC